MDGYASLARNGTGADRRRGAPAEVVGTGGVRDKVYVAVAIALFAVAVIVHVACGDFPKAIDVLPDERRYLEIARSLFSGNGLIIRGEASGFQKILYPVSLFPALLVDDGQTQIKVVGVLNSLYACSTVFPALAFARRLFDDPRAIIACLAFTVVTPDLMYSMTFMSEPLFLPLSLWTVYLCWRSFEAHGRRRLVLSACAGVLCYAAYLCKEVAWMYVIAYLAWQVTARMRKRQGWKSFLSATGLFLAGFFAPFVLMKATLFSGLGNSYAQFSFDILLSPYTVLFGLYSLAVDGVHLIVAFGVFPVLFCALAYRDVPREDRDLLFFCLASFVIGLMVVVFTISMREDVGHVMLRQHARYVAPLAVALTMLFAKHALRLDPRSIMGSPRRRDALVTATTGFCMLVAMLFGAANFSQGFDYAQFHALRWLLGQAGELDQSYFDGVGQTLSAIDATDGALLEINWIVALARAAVIVFTATGMSLLFCRRRVVRKAAVLSICAIIAACMAANSAALFSYNRNAYDVDPADVTEICAISNMLENRADGNEVIVVLDDANTGANNLIDTYLQDGAGAYRYLVVDEFERLVRRAADANVEGSSTSKAATDGGTLGSVGYILVNRSQNVDLDGYGVVTEAGGDNASRFTLYRVP